MLYSKCMTFVGRHRRIIENRMSSRLLNSIPGEHLNAYIDKINSINKSVT